MLVGTLAALAAWDLDHFERRLRTAQRVEAQGALIRAHLRRLSIVAGLGLTLGGIALSVQVEITFGWALLLGLLAFLALSGVIAFGQREREG
jgi:thiosulfate reductase cytochrome b subunit